MSLVFESDFSVFDERWKPRHTPDPDLPAWNGKGRIIDGRLLLNLRKRQETVYTTHLSVLDTPFVFGQFEARMRFFGPKGAHSCFWLQDVEPDHIGGSEVDIVENFGSETRTWSNVYYRTPETMWPAKPTGWRSYTAHDPRDWHVYGLEWTENRYTFSIDGKVSSVCEEGLSSRPKVMILSMLSSEWEWKNLQRDNLSDYRTLVDWVRVYD